MVQEYLKNIFIVELKNSSNQEWLENPWKLIGPKVWKYWISYEQNLSIEFCSWFLMFQLELSAFRAKWMSELQPSSGGKRSVPKTADLKRRQEIAKEEKVWAREY